VLDIHPRPTQPSIPPGSVNEYQLRLGRQRQVWLIPLAMGAVSPAHPSRGVQVKLRSLENACQVCLRQGAIQIHVYLTFTLPSCSFTAQTFHNKNSVAATVFVDRNKTTSFPVFYQHLGLLLINFSFNILKALCRSPYLLRLILCVHVLVLLYRVGQKSKLL